MGSIMGHQWNLSFKTTVLRDWPLMRDHFSRNFGVHVYASYLQWKTTCHIRPLFVLPWVVVNHRFHCNMYFFISRLWKKSANLEHNTAVRIWDIIYSFICSCTGEKGGGRVEYTGNRIEGGWPKIMIGGSELWLCGGVTLNVKFVIMGSWLIQFMSRGGVQMISNCGGGYIQITKIMRGGGAYVFQLWWDGQGWKTRPVPRLLFKMG